MWEIVTYVVIAGLGIGGWMWWNSVPTIPSAPITATTPEYRTITPQISPSFAEQKFVGRVIDNSFAMIHSRREGVVRDILVDVGDTVSTGQVVAVLFPPGVEGQSSTKISRALAELKSAQESLRTADVMATESIASAQKNIDVLQHSDGGERSKLAQQYDFARTTTTQEIQNLRRLFFGNSNKSATNSSILGDFSASVQKQHVYNLFIEVENVLNRKTSDETIATLLPRAIELLDEAEILYRSATEHSNQSAATIESKIRIIQSGQSKILLAQERLDNTLLALQTAGQNLELTTSRADTTATAARTRLEIAHAAYESVLASSGNVQVTAPFAGTISARMAEVGHITSPKMALFEIVGADTALGQIAATEVQFGVPQEFLGELSIDSTVQVHQPDRGTSVTAKISRTSPALDARTQTATVHAALNTPISHNTRVIVTVTQSDAPVLLVPSPAIKRRGNKNFIWILDTNDQPRHLPVTVLAEDGEFSDIVSPVLKTDHRIIAEPSVRLWRTSTPFLTHEEND